MRGRGGRQRRPADSRGQAETIGVVLVLAMTLVGATLALAFGATGLNAARLDSQQGSVEHAMTQLDSRSAMVGLGDSASQEVPLATAGSGSYRVDADSGWIRVKHFDYDGTGNDTVVYNESLGALVYERDDTTIAYQGGGVWVSEGNASRMISPPEFHYQSATLTLPVLQVAGDSSVGGAGVTARISESARAKRVYPNQSATYPNATHTFVNPVAQGNVTVTVSSEYYQAWAEYFRTRTSGDVTVDHPNGTVSVKLISLGTVGAFEMPADGNSIEIRGLGNGHPITNFTITIQPDDADAATFNNLQWTLYADEGNQQFEIHLRKGSNLDDGTTPCTEVGVDTTVYYSDTNGDPYHGWHQPDAFVTECGDLDGDGDNETFLQANLTGTTLLEMQSLSKSDLNHFDPQGNSLQSTVNFSEHGGTVTWEDPGEEFGSGENTTIGNLTNHYLSLMGPNVELTVEDKGSDTVNEDASSGQFEQTGGSGSFITFLHITENRVTIELE